MDPTPAERERMEQAVARDLVKPAPDKYGPTLQTLEDMAHAAGLRLVHIGGGAVLLINGKAWR